MFPLSPEATKAKEEAAIRYRERKNLVAKFEQGPRFDADRGELRIPSYFWNAKITPRATDEWRKRGLLFDADAREWYYPIDARYADDQVTKARKVFDEIWGINRACIDATN